jgi:hypothetical protein
VRAEPAEDVHLSGVAVLDFVGEQKVKAAGKALEEGRPRRPLSVA